jgi:hypothetical protein
MAATMRRSTAGKGFFFVFSASNGWRSVEMLYKGVSYRTPRQSSLTVKDAARRRFRGPASLLCGHVVTVTSIALAQDYLVVFDGWIFQWLLAQ